jgi:hypothetical protein
MNPSVPFLPTKTGERKKSRVRINFKGIASSFAIPPKEEGIPSRFVGTPRFFHSPVMIGKQGTDEIHFVSLQALNQDLKRADTGVRGKWR